MKMSIAILAAAVSAVLGSACDGGPNKPSDSVQRLELQAPRDLAPGSTAQLKAIAYLVTGRTEDVTAQTTWSSLRSAVAAVSADGRVSALTKGDALFAASYSGKNEQVGIFIVPAGTYRLTGEVREPNGPRVSSARIEVVSEPSGLETTTNGLGVFTLHGVPPQTTIRISKEGYVTREEQIAIADHAQRNFELSLPPGRENLQGEWTISITASSSCGSRLPADMLTRRYTGAVAQRGDDLTVTLGGAQFLVGFWDHDQIIGKVRETDVGLSFPDSSPEFAPYPGIVEIIDTNRLYAPYGEASISADNGRYAGRLNGSITAGENSSTGYREMANCTATDHQIVLQRK